MVYGGGRWSSAVVSYLGKDSTFWWNGWLILVHVILFVLAVLVLLKTARAIKTWFKESVDVRGSGSVPPAVMDTGTQCEMVHLAGLTVKGLQEECRRTGLRTNGLRAELVARVGNELRRRDN